MNIKQRFLIFSSLGLLPIALSYGLMPTKSLNYLFGIDDLDLNSIHIFRAIMGLYLALIVFWLVGSFKADIRQAALYSHLVFMFGLAGGRTLSLLVDGMPHWILSMYLALELVFGILCIFVIRMPESKED